jgi:hypothetical protein
MADDDDRFRIPDSDLLFPEVKMARGLAGRTGWRRAFAWAWLLALIAALGVAVTMLAIHGA